mgnify:CR=1 FL=1|jgi:hypothetical protein
MKKLIFVLSVFFSITVSGQYVNSLGLRGGLRGVGLTYKHYLSPNFFLNLDGVGTYSQQLQGGEIVAILNVRNKIHNTFFQSKELTWSYGAGLHSGYYQDPDNKNSESHLILGPDFRLGAEYLFHEKICFGADATLFYNVLPSQKVEDMEVKYSQIVGLGVFLRYVIQ